MRISSVCAALALSGAILLAGCAAEPTPDPVATSAPPTSESPSVTPTATPEPTPEPTQTPAPTPDSWVRSGDARGPVSFELPPGWSLVHLPSAYDDMGFFQAQIVDAAGVGQLYFSNRVTGIGGACTGEMATLHLEELDSAPVEIAGFAPAAADPAGTPTTPVRFVYRVSNLGDGAVASLSLANSTPRDACMYYNLLLGGAVGSESTMVVAADFMQVDSTSSGRSFATRAEAEAFMQSEEYATLKRILMSIQLQA
ncbi:hypothetical protein [Leucobacter musarum]|uniref:hypothetical protein n=1 Tax=Leucobacter musarum TaxID=1930747 RepID=UPI0012E27396|nr:hypothetical protein [Leucobacter musarum]